MDNTLDRGFKENIHHGLVHASDLLFKAKLLAAAIARERLVDWKVISASILLHDIFAAKSEPHGQAAADSIVENHDLFFFFTPEQIEKIKQAVAFHDKKITIELKLKQELNLETKIVYDVDNLDAFWTKGIYRYFCAHIGRSLLAGKTAAEAFKKIKAKVPDNLQKRRENLYFDVSRQIADNDFSLTKMFFDKLVGETYPLGTYKGATGIFSFIWENFNQKPWQISEKVKIYFEQFSTEESDDEEKIFIQEFFKKLGEIYSNIQLKANSLDGFLEFLEDEELQSILSFIEKKQ